MNNDAAAPEDALMRLRRQRGMQHLQDAISEASLALARVRARTASFGPEITLAYSLEHARTSLIVLSKVITLPDSGRTWIDTYGESVRNFRNRVDHYDEDIERKGDLEAQLADAMGITAIHRDAIELRIHAKGKHWVLKPDEALNDLQKALDALHDANHHRWRAPL